MYIVYLKQCSEGLLNGGDILGRHLTISFTYSCIIRKWVLLISIIFPLLVGDIEARLFACLLFYAIATVF